MKNKYDIVIAGAGPAGANCARILSKNGLKVLLVERNQEIGAPNFSSAGTPSYVLKEFSLPKTIVGGTWDKFEIVADNKNKIWHYKKPRGYVLKFNELKKFLVGDAIKNSCDVLVGTNIVKFQKTQKGVVVEFTGINKSQVSAKIIVDATGPAGILATQAKLRKQIPIEPSVGLEYIMTNVKFKTKNNLAFYLGKNYVPHGYAWIFPMGKNTAKVGVAVYENSKYKDVSPINYLKDFVKKVDILKDAQPLELHGSSLYVTGGNKKLISGNLVVIGDAAMQVNPLGAEGIRHALYASKFAAAAITKAIRKNNFKYLKEYENSWKKYVGNKWKISFLLTKVVYPRLSGFDKGLEAIKHLSADDIFDLMFEYKFTKVFKLLRTIPAGKLKRESLSILLSLRKT